VHGDVWSVMCGMRLFRSGMLGVVHMWNDEVEGFYNDQIINQKRIYSQRFAMANHICISLIFPFYPMSLFSY